MTITDALALYDYNTLFCYLRVLSLYLEDNLFFL
jgi:hypothetical protein